MINNYFNYTVFYYNIIYQFVRIVFQGTGKHNGSHEGGRNMKKLNPST